MKKLLLVLVTLAVCLALLPVGSSNIQADGPTPVSVPAEEGDGSIQADGPTPVNVPAADENADFVDIVGVPQLVAAPEGKLEVLDGVVGMPQSVEAPEEEISVNTSQVGPRGVSPTLPGDFHASAGSVTVTSVWTTDGSGNNKTTFNCGDSIRYYGNVYNNTGSSKTAYFSWSVTGPCGSIASWSGNQTTANGNAVWYLPATIPSGACAGTYTYKLSVTYGGSTSYKSINFTVNCGGGSVTVTSVWTTDGSGNNKTTFNCGDSIRYYGNVYNNTGSSKTAYFSWSVTGPCGSIASWSGNQTTANGNAVWYLPATIPSNACAGTYTYKLSVTYGGSTSYKSINFTVNCGGGSVTVTSVWTTDGSGNNKTTFNCGDSIRYYGNVYNNTGSSKTAYFSWSVTGPCGSIASWSGNQTTANGNAVWYLPATIPSNACAGTYTYKLSVTYGGSTSYKSINFTVNCGGGWRLPWQGSWSFTGGPHVYGIWPSSPCNQLTNGVPSGLDFSGGSVVLAIDAGTVVTASSGLEGFCGYDVKIKHGSYIVGYMHMKSPAQGGVQWTVGQTVQQGTKVGVTGGCSPVHLHLELYDVNGGRVSWDGMRIDGYAVHVVRRISDGQIHNYEGSMTKGTEDPRTVTMCGNYGQATLVLAPETAIAGTAEPGCYGGICRTRQVTSTNTLRP
jgi:hypothetical protein